MEREKEDNYSCTLVLTFNEKASEIEISRYGKDLQEAFDNSIKECENILKDIRIKEKNAREKKPDLIYSYGLQYYSCECPICGYSSWDDKGMNWPEKNIVKHIKNIHNIDI